MKKELKILALPALILADIALVLSWVPIINRLALVAIILAVLLAAISLIINRAKTKTMTTTALITSLCGLLMLAASRLLLGHSLNAVEEILLAITRLLEPILRQLPF